ncbi:Dihydrodipicolinate synthase [Coemansia javaensis]|uniref:Dihydrodipicolinate synthase n=1 Tax=Coemansia javaensis TaxID=2761396 RepID=A0A9W8HMZ2_9FUNG|nr:Dihydrodipicolinate synthase [Coemansia javaensis]
MDQDTVKAAVTSVPQQAASLLERVGQYLPLDVTNKVHVGLAGLVVFFVVRSVVSALSRSGPERFAMEGVRKVVPPKRDFAHKELAEYDGRDEATPLYIAVKGIVYDVSSNREFYGPGGPYANFAGRDASRGLALSSFDKDVVTSPDEPIDDLGDLDKSEQASLDEWAEFFAGKYTPIGRLVGPTAPRKTDEKKGEEKPADEAKPADDEKPAAETDPATKKDQ